MARTSSERRRRQAVFFLGIALVTASMLVGWTAMRYGLSLRAAGEHPDDAVQAFRFEELPADHRADLLRAMEGETLTYTSAGALPGHTTGTLVVYYRGTPYAFSRRLFFDVGTLEGMAAVAMALSGLGAIGWAVRREMAAVA